MQLKFTHLVIWKIWKYLSDVSFKDDKQQVFDDTVCNDQSAMLIKYVLGFCNIVIQCFRCALWTTDTQVSGILFSQECLNSPTWKFFKKLSLFYSALTKKREMI